MAGLARTVTNALLASVVTYAISVRLQVSTTRRHARRAGLAKTVTSVLLASVVTCAINRQAASQLAMMNVRLAGQASSVTCTLLMIRHARRAGLAQAAICVRLASAGTAA